ncbi:MAG: hypothetical protein NC117_04515 [Pseudoflavonifractor sp.]|nr:hypothetical protein [Pseudoflavonifractor sp.]
MKHKTRYLVALIVGAVTAGVALDAGGCTSAIIGASRSATGRPLLWKNRDTGTEHNFVARVEPRDSSDIGYVALFNGGDSLLLDAWIGVNEAGFAVMNTASYNLVPDTASYKDREGAVMTEALRRCRSVGDFAALLAGMPRPMGVQANFGVIDANGNGGYFETDDYDYTFYPLDESDGVLVRTNYSYSGDSTSGFGYIRHENAVRLLKPYLDGDSVTASTFTDGLSRSFYHSLLDKDMSLSGDRWVVDQDFIPRYSTSASVVVEGVAPGEDPSLSIMWTAIGYPPCSHVVPVFLDDVPLGLRPAGAEWRSPMCDSIVELKHWAFPIARGSGQHYVNMSVLAPISGRGRDRSLENYRLGYKRREMISNDRYKQKTEK